MKSHPDYQAMLLVLKEALKARGFTYKTMAKCLSLSEVTIKRIFSSGHPCTLERIIQICDQIGVSFLDVASLAKKEVEVDYFLSATQESYFADHPAHFAIFKELYGGTAGVEVIRSWKLSPTLFFKILRKLEKLGLMDVLPGNKIRWRVRGNIRMSHRGPLAKKILRPQINLFLDHIDRVLENDDVCMHSSEIELSPTHIEEFVEEIHALGSKYRARAFRDKSLISKSKLKMVRWLFCFAPYETPWRQYKA